LWISEGLQLHWTSETFSDGQLQILRAAMRCSPADTKSQAQTEAHPTLFVAKMNCRLDDAICWVAKKPIERKSFLTSCILCLPFASARKKRVVSFT